MIYSDKLQQCRLMGGKKGIQNETDRDVVDFHGLSISILMIVLLFWDGAYPFKAGT